MHARDDDIPEGDLAYECYLVSADNGGVIGSDRNVRIHIDANDDGYGVISVDPSTSLVYVGEADHSSYNGRINIRLNNCDSFCGEVERVHEIKMLCII